MSESIDTIISRGPIEASTDLIDFSNVSEIVKIPTRNEQLLHQRKIRSLKSHAISITQNIPNPNTANAPRYLNESEIRFILTGLPTPANLPVDYANKFPIAGPRAIYSSDPEISINIYNNLYVYFHRMLEEIRLTPYAINDYKQNFTQYFSIARAIAYTTVGNIAADAIGAPLTQMTLNSFASLTGTSVSYGLDYGKELLDASDNRKQLSMSIHFRNKFLRFEDVLNLRSTLVSVYLNDITTNYDILEYSDLRDKYWYNLYNLVEPVKYTEYGLRLYLDVDKLYSYEIDMQTLVSMILKTQSGLLSIVPSPLHEGIIDIYPLENLYDQFKPLEKSLNITSSNSSIIFLNNVVLPNLSKIKIKGIKDINNLFAFEVNLWSCIKTENKLDQNNYLLILNTKYMENNNLKTDRLLQLFAYLKLEVAQIFEDRIIIKSEESPNKLINKVLDVEEEKIKEQYASLKTEFLKGNGKLFSYPSTEFFDLYHYVFAKTSGSNLQEVLALDFVDSDIVVTNDIHGTKRVLGIEAARNILIKDLLDSLTSQNNSIDARHLVFTSDYLTNTGDYIGFTYTGLSYQDNSDFDRISFQRSFDVAIEKSVFGSLSNLTSATSSVFVGETGKYGSGAPILEIDNKTRASYLETISKVDKVSADSLTDAINNLNLDDLENFDDSNLEYITNNQKEGTKIPRFDTLSNTEIKKTEKIPEIKEELNIKPTPIVSNLFQSSLNKIKGVPVLTEPTPYKLPTPDNELYIPPGNAVFSEQKNVLNVETPVGRIIGVPIGALTESKNAAIPIVNKTVNKSTPSSLLLKLQKKK